MKKREEKAELKLAVGGAPDLNRPDQLYAGPYLPYMPTQPSNSAVLMPASSGFLQGTAESRLLNLVGNGLDSYQPRAQRVMRAKLFSENMLPYKRRKKSSSTVQPTTNSKDDSEVLDEDVKETNVLYQDREEQSEDESAEDEEFEDDEFQKPAKFKKGKGGKKREHRQPLKPPS